MPDGLSSHFISGEIIHAPRVDRFGQHRVHAHGRLYEVEVLADRAVFYRNKYANSLLLLEKLRPQGGSHLSGDFRISLVLKWGWGRLSINNVDTE